MLASSSYTPRPLIGRQNRITRELFRTMAKASFIEENVAHKFAGLLGRPTLLLFVHCAHTYFSLDLLAGYTVSGCYEITMLT